LWYAHSAVGPALRLAEMAADHVVSASPESFRLPSRKLIVAGHGIDTAQFAPAQAAEARPFTFGTVGRVGPKKQTGLLVEAARLLAAEKSADVRVRIVGGPLPGDEAYADRLRAAAREYGLSDVVEFAGEVRFDQVAEEYHHMDAAVNLSLTGSIDKAALEAMACGLPVVALGEGLRGALPAGLAAQVIMPDPDAMAARLAALAAMPPGSRRAFGLALRDVVVHRHALDGLAGRIIAAFRAC
jgi:glycosyltransferase involved in cell wall biosynthesis